MVNEKYTKWLREIYMLNGPMITQAQAAKMLGKTKTRIKQMINENKINAIAFENDTPLISFREVLEIYNNLYSKQANKQAEPPNQQIKEVLKSEITKIEVLDNNNVIQHISPNKRTNKYTKGVKIEYQDNENENDIFDVDDNFYKNTNKLSKEEIEEFEKLGKV